MFSCKQSSEVDSISFGSSIARLLIHAFIRAANCSYFMFSFPVDCVTFVQLRLNYIQFTFTIYFFLLCFSLSTVCFELPQFSVLPVAIDSYLSIITAFVY